MKTCLVYCLVLLRHVEALSVEPVSSKRAVALRSSSWTQTAARAFRPYDNEEHDELSRRQRRIDRPTDTKTQRPDAPIIPDKPKILVLGASGKIGRLVVQQLMQSSVEATIVAFVRDYDKACRVLYDEMLVAKSRKAGPKLQIVEGDLVEGDLPNYSDDEEESIWLQKATSAAKFYGTSVEAYDNRDDNDQIDTSETLQEAIRGSSTIISCVGDVRPTNLWTDFIKRPLWRVLRKDVSSWCRDPRHPFYVHFATTRKALGFAEKEQIRREATAQDKEKVPRIRFIRISDLCVAHKPWSFVPLLTNVLHSLVFRYQDMAERLLAQSSLIETVTIRPGDLVDDERDASSTSLQVDISGRVSSPARVGREDVAALAVAATFFDSNDHVSPKRDLATVKRERNSASRTASPFHYCLACRWAGSKMAPFPAQGSAKEGLPTAELCMQEALRQIRRKEKRERRLNRRQSTAARLARNMPSTRIKPYGICTALPVYLFLGMFMHALVRTLLPVLPGRSWIILAWTRFTHVFVAAQGSLADMGNAHLGGVIRLLTRGASKTYISI